MYTMVTWSIVPVHPNLVSHGMDIAPSERENCRLLVLTNEDATQDVTNCTPDAET